MGAAGRAAASLRSAERCAPLRAAARPPQTAAGPLAEGSAELRQKKRRLGSKEASSTRWNLGPFAYRIINEAFNQAEFPSLRKELVIPRNNQMVSSWLPCRLPSRDLGGGDGGRISIQVCSFTINTEI